MFRRNKNKGAKSQLQDDMVALTGPDVLSSSSLGADKPVSKSNKGGRFIGRRKKKIVGTGKGKSSTNVLGNSGRVAGTQPTAAAKNMQLNLARKPQTPPPTQQRHAPELVPLAVIKQPPSNNIASTTNAAATEERNLGQWKPPHRPNNILEMRESRNNDAERQSSSRSNPLAPPRSDVSRGSSVTSSSNNAVSREPSSASHRVCVSQRDTSPAQKSAAPAPFVSKPPPMVMKGGGQVSADSAVPMTRTGWSIQSNASSAMNSEHYIQSLDNLPIIRSGKVSLFIVLFLVIPRPRIHLIIHMFLYSGIPNAWCPA